MKFAGFQGLLNGDLARASLRQHIFLKTFNVRELV